VHEKRNTVKAILLQLSGELICAASPVTV